MVTIVLRATGGLHRARHAGQVHGQVHQPPQRPVRHDELIQPLLGLGPPRGVLRNDSRQRSVQQAHDDSFSFKWSGIPQQISVTASARAAIDLIGPADQVAIAAGLGVLGHHAQADLVGDEDHRAATRFGPRRASGRIARQRRLR